MIGGLIARAVRSELREGSRRGSDRRLGHPVQLAPPSAECDAPGVVTDRSRGGSSRAKSARRLRRRALIRRQIVYAGLATFGLGLGLVGIHVGLVFTLIGITIAYLLARAGRHKEAVETYLAAARRLHEGNPAGALRVLDEAEASGVHLASLPRTIALVRGEAAFQEGRAAEAIAIAHAALAAPIPRLDPLGDGIAMPELLALAAVAHATRGDDDEARARIAAIELDISSSPRSLARAVIAAATLLARDGQKSELAKRLERGRRVLEMAGSRRERALARAFLRFSQAPSPSVYRRADVAREVVAGDWVSVAAGAAVDFLPPVAPASKAPKVVKESPRRPPERRPVLRVAFGLTSLVVAVTAAVHYVPLLAWKLWPWPDSLAPGQGGMQLVVLATLLGGLVVALRARHTVHSVDRLVLAAGAWARGDEKGARRAWDELLRDPNPRIAAGAALWIGSTSLREGDPATAAGFAERGLGRLALVPSTDPTPSFLRPELTALWAFARAGSDPKVARGAAATLPSYVGVRRAHFRIELAARIAEGDLARAGEWADLADREPMLDAYDEILADAVRLASKGHAIAATERTRIADAIREPDKLRFLEGIAPGLAQTALEVASSPEALPEAAAGAGQAADQLESERDAAAEEEHGHDNDPAPHRRFTTRPP